MKKRHAKKKQTQARAQLARALANGPSETDIMAVHAAVLRWNLMVIAEGVRAAMYPHGDWVQ